MRGRAGTVHSPVGCDLFRAREDETLLPGAVAAGGVEATAVELTAPGRGHASRDDGEAVRREGCLVDVTPLLHRLGGEFPAEDSLDGLFLRLRHRHPVEPVDRGRELARDGVLVGPRPESEQEDGFLALVLLPLAVSTAAQTAETKIGHDTVSCEKDKQHEWKRLFCGEYGYKSPTTALLPGEGIGWVLSSSLHLVDR